MTIKRNRLFHLLLAAGTVAAFLVMAQSGGRSFAQSTCNPLLDADCDGVPDSIDNCKYLYNPNQENNDAALETPPYVLGDACDRDDDNDGVLDDAGLGDACPSSDVCNGARTCSVTRTACTTNADCNGSNQVDPCMVLLQSCLTSGQFCNSDADCPMLTDTCGNHCMFSNVSCDPANDQCSRTGCDDNCQFTANPGQADGDGDAAGDACDNCIAAVNPSQANVDGDLLGDVCDPDIDGDSFLQDPSIMPVCSVVPDPFGNPPGPDPNTVCRDNCPYDHNMSQWDQDRDLIGTVCDNCVVRYNPSQLDVDSDQVGDACDNCLNASNSSQENKDTDALGDACDNCKDKDNNSQADSDFDGVGDACDDCPHDYDPGQGDRDKDGKGDVCDPCPADPANVFPYGDRDLDGVCDSTDNCIGVANASQLDSDGDGQGDVCDCDRDGDGLNDKTDRIVDSYCIPGFGCGFFIVYDQCFTDQTCYNTVRGSSTPACNRTGGLTPPCCIDNCPDTSNANQANGDGDNEGDVCDPTPLVSEPGPGASFDRDGDSAADAIDNCPGTFNPTQADLDGDAVGDACDGDADGDGVLDQADNCKMLANPTQDDWDGDAVGDDCDNCRWAANALQEDADADAQGDRCDVDDGQIALQFDTPATISWDGEATFDRWITVVGDLSVLRSSGQYLQDPGLIPVAAVHCGSTATFQDASQINPAPGQAVFFVTGGLTDLIQNGFGRATDGSKRIVQDVCP